MLIRYLLCKLSDSIVNSLPVKFTLALQSNLQSPQFCHNYSLTFPLRLMINYIVLRRDYVLLYWRIFKSSLYDFKKIANGRMLPIGKTFTYVFLFVFIFTLISFSRFIFGDAELFEMSPELQEQSEKIGVLIYPIAFGLQLVISVFYIFIRISLFAYIGTLIMKWMKKRGQYLQVWGTTAIAMTVPFMLTIVLEFFPDWKAIGLVITSIIHLVYIVLALNYYPKQLPGKKKMPQRS